MGIQQEIERIASKRVGGQSLKERFSHGGTSFWWRLKNMCHERRVRELTSQNFFTNCTLRYNAGLLKDRLASHLARGSGPQSPGIIVFSLLRNKNKYFTEVEAELRKRKADFSMVLVLPHLPKPGEMANPGGLTLEGFLDGATVREEAGVRKKFSALSGIVAQELEAAGLEREKAGLYARFFTEKEIPEAFRLERMAQRMMERLKPKIVLLASETGKHSYPVIAAARRMGVKTAALAHGTGGGLKCGAEFTHLDENVSRSREDRINFLEPDFYLSYGELDRRHLLEAGNYSRERIIPCGQPRMDLVAGFVASADRSSLRAKYGFAGGKKALLWATQTHMAAATAEDNERNAEAVYGGVKALGGEWELAIKLHPGEDPAGPLYKRFNEGGRFAPAKIIYSRWPEASLELLAAADAVVTTMSSIGAEALVAGKPLLLVDPAGKYDLSYYTTGGAGAVVGSAEDVARVLRDIGTPEHVKRFAAAREAFLREACANLGHSAEKIADFLEEQAEGR